MKLLLLVFASIVSISQVLGGNILVLCPMCSRSHKNIIEATVGGLAERNHSITLVSSYKTPIDSPHIKDIIVMKGFDFFENTNVIEMRKLGIFSAIKNNLFQLVLEGCHKSYQNLDVMNLLNETFDLAFIDAFTNACLQGLLYRLQVPIIQSMPLPSPSPFSMVFGNYQPPSFVPEPMLPFGEEMNFFQRTLNVVVGKLFWFYYYSWYSEHERIYKSYLGDDIPGLGELESQINMMLANSHFSINSPRPTLPDVVEIGGVHCRAGRPLPKDLEDFMSGAKDGVILFSLGSIFKGRDMPEETRKAFLNVFSQLQQRVLWKWDHHDMTDLPGNVKLSKWLPVQDILAHRNTKLFITHGGLLSTQEAIYHGVPLVGIPLFGDQDLNINRYVSVGIAVSLEILEIQEKDIFEAINRALNTPTLQENVKSMSRLFRDKPMSALDTAVFWSEYVMRHKGAPQLRSIARKLSFIQYHSLDVMGFLLLILLGFLTFSVFVVRKLYGKLFRATVVVSVQKKNS